MEMVVGLLSLRTKWPHKHSWAERCRDGSKLLNGFRIIEQGVANPVYVRRCSPCMNALRAADLMRRRPVAAVRADENRRVSFAPKILQESCQQNDCARHIMRKLTQKQPRLTAINKHQFREREVRRQPNLVRVLPTADFIEKPRESMNIALKICLRFARPQQPAVLLRQIKTVNRVQQLSVHSLSAPLPLSIDKSPPKSLRLFRVGRLLPNQIRSR